MADFQVFVCNRGTRRRYCATPGCHQQPTGLCEFPVTRKGVAGKCDRPMCGGHTVKMPGGAHYCAGHARATELLAGGRK